VPCSSLSYCGRMHPGDQAAATPNHAESTTPPPSSDQMESEETRLAHEVLATEYNVLMAALSASWSASLTRTSLFLGVLTAAGVGFAFASQGGMETSAFLTLSLLVLILVLFLGDRHLYPACRGTARVDGLYHRHEQDPTFLSRSGSGPVAHTSCSLSTTTNRLSTAASEPGCAGTARGFDSCT
jgi:hypothetical protein